MARVDFKIEGMKELERTIKELGKLPQKCVTPAAKKGNRIALLAARANAPWRFGDLANGIVQKGERTRKRGKKVYQVVMDKNKNDIFVKTTKDGKRYYYPASMEYGFITRNGGYVLGHHFLRDSIDDNKKEIERVTVQELAKRIDKLR